MKKIILSLLALVIVGSAVFFACKKNTEEVVKENSVAKYHKDGTLANPFEQAGIAHNACLDAITEQMIQNENLSWEEVCNIIASVIDQYFAEGLTDFSSSEAMNICNVVETDLQNNNLVSMVNGLVEQGLINMNFQASIISRNNYDILYDYWTQIEAMRASSTIDIDYQVSLTKEIEQEIIRNYYNLLDNGEMKIDNGNILYREYQLVLSCVSVGVYSCLYWVGPNNYESYILMNADPAYRADVMRADFHGMARGYIEAATGSQDGWTDQSLVTAYAAAASYKAASGQ
jgi:hypothetical protein